MYRCYLLRDGRIAKAENLEVKTLTDAIVTGRKLLVEQPVAKNYTGIEIWQAASLLYSDMNDRDAPPDAESRLLIDQDNEASPHLGVDCAEAAPPARDRVSG